MLYLLHIQEINRNTERVFLFGGLDSRGLRIVLRPDLLELVQMVGTQDRPVAGQVVEVVHDHRHEQIDNLQDKFD